jgi:hypothetical protein
LGTIAIEIDGEQSSNDESFSRKIQLRSVLEILVFAAFVRAEGVGSGPEQRKLALETALADVSALKAA